MKKYVAYGFDSETGIIKKLYIDHRKQKSLLRKRRKGKINISEHIKLFNKSLKE